MSQDDIDNDTPGRERCTICGLIARNKTELEDHIKHAHQQTTKSDNSDGLYSEEQKIDPFIKPEK